MSASAPGTGPHTAYIGLGANLDDPAQQVSAAMTALDAIERTRVCGRSSLYRSAPVGYADQPDFVNAVACVETGLAPRALLEALLALESAHGRVRDAHAIPKGPRTLDLDLLLYGVQQVNEPDLVIPHPRMHERAFVLLPLAEIAPHACIPGRGPVARLLEQVRAQDVERIERRA